MAELIGSYIEQSWLQSGLAEAHRLVGDSDSALMYAGHALELAWATGRVQQILVEVGQANL